MLLFLGVLDANEMPGNIADTPHDFSSDEKANEKLCIYCHINEDMTIENPSLMCLSCHDGVSSSISLNNSHQGLQKYNFGELGGNHPISIEYKPSERLKDIKNTDMLKGPDNNMVECTSCHDAHKKKGSGEANFLRYPNKNSNLCFQCHNL